MCIRIVALYAATDSKLFWIKKKKNRSNKTFNFNTVRKSHVCLVVDYADTVHVCVVNDNAGTMSLFGCVYISNGNNFNGQTKLEVTIFAKTEKKNYNGPMKRVLNKKHFCKKFIAEIQIPQRNRNYFQRINEHS